jgi:hypothetical protein
MTTHRNHEDPLHDGSPGSYFARFVICFMLGMFLEVILLFALEWFIFDEVMETAFSWWAVWPVVPLAMGVVGIFKFDWIVAIYDYFHKDYAGGR